MEQCLQNLNKTKIVIYKYFTYESKLFTFDPRYKKDITNSCNQKFTSLK